MAVPVAVAAFFFLIYTWIFSRMVRPIDKAPISLSEEEVALHAGHKVLVEVDKSEIIFGIPKVILS